MAMKDYGFKRGSVGPLAITALVFLALAIAGIAAHGWYAQRLLREQRADVRAEVSLVGNALSVAIDRRLNLVSGVAAISREGASPPVVEQFFGAFTGSTPGIGAIALAPGGTVTYAYPHRENQHLLGNNLLRHPNAAIRAGAEEALATSELSLAGPVDLPDRAPSLVAQQALFREGQFSEMIYFDFALSPILARAGLGTASDPFAVVLRDQAGNLIYGSGDVLSQNPVFYDIVLPEGRWELAAVPGDGWDAAVSSPLLVFDAFVLVIVLLTSGIACLVASRQAHLRQAVRLRTQEISEVNRQLEEDIAERKRVEAALREREQQYRSIFEAVSDGLFINTLDGRLVDFNPAAAQMHGYSVEEFGQVQPPQFIHPDSSRVFDEYLEEVRAGRKFQARAVDVHKNGSTFPVEVQGTSFSYRGQRHTLAVVRDITEQVEARRLLEERVEERTRELSTLLDISHDVASVLDLERLLPSLFDYLKRIVDYHSVVLAVMESEDDFLWLEHRGPASDSDATAPAPWQPGEHDRPVVRELARLPEPLIIRDLQADTPEAETWRKNAELRSGGPPEYAGCWMAVPLRAKDRPIGVLSFLHEQPGYYTERSAQLALALASQAAVAIENARLFKLEQRRAEQLRSIAEVSREITGVLALEELANQAAFLIQQAFGYYHLHIGLIEGDEVVFRPSAGVWRDQRECHYCQQHRFLVGQVGGSGRVAASGEPLLVRNVQQDPHYLPVDDRQAGSALILPLKVRGKIIGVLNIESDDVDGFSKGDIGVLQPLANQLAVALENARLYEQAQALAALQERQKLARELHDSVSQALFGIGLGTRTALKLVESDSAEKRSLAQPLQYVLSLASSGLAEMRALIFELRPESLEAEGLVPALTRRVEALRARQEFQIEAELGAEPELPVATKEMLYRVVQEALHNAARHADAGHVAVSLSTSDGDVVLEVRDDGRGFDPRANFPGHLGLQSMRERVQAAGGALTIDSAPGQGTTVRVAVTGVAVAPAVQE